MKKFILYFIIILTLTWMWGKRGDIKIWYIKHILKIEWVADINYPQQYSIPQMQPFDFVEEIKQSPISREETKCLLKYMYYKFKSCIKKQDYWCSVNDQWLKNSISNCVFKHYIQSNWLK